MVFSFITMRVVLVLLSLILSICFLLTFAIILFSLLALCSLLVNIRHYHRRAGSCTTAIMGLLRQDAVNYSVYITTTISLLLLLTLFQQPYNFLINDLLNAVPILILYISR